ncbi:polcalcin Cup a 4-like [Magnolia sinica]|uniref:polcalcin Cup a 4-like n=1 Tax=Magnolia sinica TaxID=86752 RepID=UPI0026591236|nr:polcalcin Cup a 4-like [Magnolia sinica]
MGRSFFGLNKAKKPSKYRSRKSSLDSSVSSSSSASESPGSPPSAVAIRIQDSNDLRQVFDKYDANGDGKISSSELQAMLRCLGSPGTDEEVESMMQAADLNMDGYISLEEFISVNTMETDSAKCIEDLRNAFTVFDRDNNGLISAEELHGVLRMMGEKASLSDCKRMIKGVDRNGDGAVNFEEFMQMMTKSA